MNLESGEWVGRIAVIARNRAIGLESIAPAL